MKFWISLGGGVVPTPPIPTFRFGRTGQASTVFRNYNYLLRGGRRIARADYPSDTLRYFIFRSDDQRRNRGAYPLGYLDLIVDDRNKVKDVLGIQRAFVSDEWLGQGVREEVIPSLLKTIEHDLTVHTVDQNVLKVLQNLHATDTTTNQGVHLGTVTALLKYNPALLENEVTMTRGTTH